MASTSGLIGSTLVLILLAGSQASAQTSMPPKPRPETSRLQPTKPVVSNPCSQLGAGFIRLEGSDTCVKIGGGIGVGVGAVR